MALAFSITLLAGLATSIGGLLAVHDRVRERGVALVAGIERLLPASLNPARSRAVRAR